VFWTSVSVICGVSTVAISASRARLESTKGRGP
jgi:hypothetical protein